MSLRRPTALIADDEPLLRDSLQGMLTEVWPALQVVAQARNGREAVNKFETLQPDICFLDVHMPGMTGVEAARHIGRRAHLVFVTAFDQYAVQAFSQGVLDYLVKPVERPRLAETAVRIQERLRTSHPAPNTDELLRQIAASLQQNATPPPLRWVRAAVKQAVQLIPVDDIDFLRSDEKYTVVAWCDESGEPREAVIRMTLKELLQQLDRSQFAQVHRSVVVNMEAIKQITRGDNETADIHLKKRRDVLPVSRSYLHLFKQM
jgi:DNA-binding LytR/AlgR family response regulator